MNNQKIKESTSCSGYCVKCGEEHALYNGNAYNHCLNLIEEFKKHKRIDFDKPVEEADPKLSIDYLYGEARGQMFGILECLNSNNEIVTVKAFSCKYNGIWEVDGWAPPLFDADVYMKMMRDGDSIITPLGDELAMLPNGSPEKREMKRKRKSLSQDLMKELHGLYKLHNFNNQQSSLYDAFHLDKGMPTGTGDCCAPKLLNYAAKNNLKPVSIAEFFWGKENVSGTRFEGEFYSSCEGKCQPILGFLLCGIS